MQGKPSANRSAAQAGNGNADKGGVRERPTLSVKDILVRLVGLGLVDAVAIWFAYSLIGNEQVVPAIVLLVVTAIINWLFLDDRLYPIRWLTPGLLLML